MKTKIALMIGILLLAITQDFGQEISSLNYSGTVIDNITSERLIGANISTDKKGITATDEYGNFIFTLTDQPKEIKISYIGYETLHLTPENCNGVIKLQPFATKLDQVVVSASSTIDIAKSLKYESSSVKIIDEQKIEEIAPKNMIDVLKTIPGVTSVARAGEIVQFKFRGVGNQQYMGEKPGVAVVVDGVPVMTNSGGIRLNMQDIKSLKVIKGSASYLYGDAALSGALIITTKKEKSNKEILLSSEIGSFGYHEYLVGATQSIDKFTLNLNGNYRRSDGYWTDSELWTKSINGKVAYYIDNSSSIVLGADKTLKFDEGGRRSVVAGETEAIANPKGAPNTAFTKDSGVNLDKYFLTYNKYFGSKYGLQVTGYYYQDLYEETSNPQDLDDNEATTNVYVSENHTDLIHKGFKSEFTMGGDKLASLVGLEIGSRDYINNSLTLADYSEYNRRSRENENYFKDELTETNSKENVQAIYGEIKYSFTPNFTTTANARYNIQNKEYITDEKKLDSIWTNTKESNSETFKNTAFRLGVNYNILNNISLFTSITTGFETPDVEDLTFYDRGTRKIINTNIEDQTSITFEIGTRGSILEDVTFDASIYQMENKDIIGPMGGTYSYGDPMDNIGDSRHRGFEISLISNQIKTLSFNLAYTYLDAKYTKHNQHIVATDNTDNSVYTSFNIVGNEIPRVSKHTANLLINYRVTNKLKIISELFVRSNYWADEMNTLNMDGYQLINLQARYKMNLFKDVKLELFAKVENLLNQQYYRAAFVHRDKRGVPGVDKEDLSITVDPGRVFYGGVKFRF